LAGVLEILVFRVSGGSGYTALVEQEKRVGSQEAVAGKLFVGGRYLTGVDQSAGRTVRVVKEALVERFR
jgi:hypothetical protein